LTNKEKIQMKKLYCQYCEKEFNKGEECFQLILQNFFATGVITEQLITQAA